MHLEKAEGGEKEGSGAAWWDTRGEMSGTANENEKLPLKSATGIVTRLIGSPGWQSTNIKGGWIMHGYSFFRTVFDSRSRKVERGRLE